MFFFVYLFLSFCLSCFYHFFILLAEKWIKIGFPRYKRQRAEEKCRILSVFYPFFILLAAKWIKIGFPRYKRQRAEEKCRILSFFYLVFILFLSVFYPFLSSQLQNGSKLASPGTKGKGLRKSVGFYPLFILFLSFVYPFFILFLSS